MREVAVVGLRGLRNKIDRLFLMALIAALPPTAVSAQAVSPAAVVQSRSGRVDATRSVSDSTRSLPYHMKRGATYGAIVGTALAGVTVFLMANSSNSCCDRPQTHVTFGHSVGILAIGAAGGAVVGAILGYSYHFNREPAK